MVSAEVHQERQRCHAVFDRVWVNGHEAYPESEPGKKRKLQRVTRNRGYIMLSFLTCIPEPLCHFGDQCDPGKLRQLRMAASTLTPSRIRSWWKEKGRDWWHNQKGKTVR
jgi:hypothetical protein